MTVEVAAHIDELNPATIGDSTDPTEGGAQISQIKQVLLTDFGQVSGAVTASDVDMNRLDIAAEGTAEATKVLTATTGGAIDGTILTWSNLGSVTTVDINGGTIDGASIGATAAGTGAFTTLTASGAVTFTSGNLDGVIIGATTPAAGTFTAGSF